MKVSNNPKSEKPSDGVSRETLNDWQRKDAARRSGQAQPHEADPKDADKKAEG
jgi:hypothetical protein